MDVPHRPADHREAGQVIRAGRVWAFLVGGALAYDVLALRHEAETLSAWCRRHQVLTLTVGGYLLAHLTGHPAVMHKYDPLHIAANMVPH